MLSVFGERFDFSLAYKVKTLALALNILESIFLILFSLKAFYQGTLVLLLMIDGMFTK